jgi:hypothetical protein
MAAPSRISLSGLAGVSSDKTGERPPPHHAQISSHLRQFLQTFYDEVFGDYTATASIQKSLSDSVRWQVSIPVSHEVNERTIRTSITRIVQRRNPTITAEQLSIEQKNGMVYVDLPYKQTGLLFAVLNPKNATHQSPTEDALLSQMAPDHDFCPITLPINFSGINEVMRQRIISHFDIVLARPASEFMKDENTLQLNEEGFLSLLLDAQEMELTDEVNPQPTDPAVNNGAAVTRQPIMISQPPANLNGPPNPNINGPAKRDGPTVDAPEHGTEKE